MLPRLNASKLVSGWIWATLIASAFAAIDGGWLASWTALAPSRIWRGELWRLVSWVFIERGPLSLVLTCACIYKFGGELAPRWGERRLRRFLLEILVGAAVATALLGLLHPDVWQLYRVSGWAVCDALVIAWARQYPDAVVSLYGLVRLSGRQLSAVTLAITFVFALFNGVLAMTPEIVVCLAAMRYPSEWLARP